MTTVKGRPGPTPPALNGAIRAAIETLCAETGVDSIQLEEFAHFVLANWKKKDPKPKPPPKPRAPAKPKALTMAQLKDAVLEKFHCADAKELRSNKDFQLAMAGEEFILSSKAGWLKLYRQWIGVPEAERHLSGPTTINGIDVLDNFRPWIAFGLNAHTATPDDVNEVFRQLVKTHHPDAGGDPRVFQQLQVMRDTLLAYFK